MVRGSLKTAGVLLALLLFMAIRVEAQTDLTPPPSVDTAPPAPKAAPAMSDTGATASSTYKLQPYDLIDVDIYSEEDLHKPARLGADGTILLPLIGSVKVGGLTVSEATDAITKRYEAGFIKNPSVMITVMQYRKSNFSILGQVQKPGIYEIPEGAHVNIIEAISMAGGYTATAAQNAVTVKRNDNGKVTVFKLKAADIAQNAEAEPFEVQAGDEVTVAAPQKSTFSVLGQVQKPGLFEIPAGASVSMTDAISLAGGFQPTASQSNVTVKRLVNGRQEIIRVNVAETVQNPNVQPFDVLPGDSIQVPYRNSTFSILGQVLKPGVYEVPEGAHINIIEAILMAGGYTRSAAQNSVTVKRMVSGKLSTIKVRAGDMADNADVVPFEVLPGDIVKVNESWY